MLQLAVLARPLKPFARGVNCCTCVVSCGCPVYHDDLMSDPLASWSLLFLSLL